jgi:hypothetical protein
MIPGSRLHRTMARDLMIALPRSAPLTVTRTICPVSAGSRRLGSTSNSSTSGRPNEGMVRARLLRNPTAQTNQGSWPLQPSRRNRLLFPCTVKSICTRLPPRSGGLSGDIPISGICRAVLVSKPSGASRASQARIARPLRRQASVQGGPMQLKPTRVRNPVGNPHRYRCPGERWRHAAGKPRWRRANSHLMRNGL